MMSRDASDPAERQGQLQKTDPAAVALGPRELLRRAAGTHECTAVVRTLRARNRSARRAPRQPCACLCVGNSSEARWFSSQFRFSLRVKTVFFVNGINTLRYSRRSGRGKAVHLRIIDRAAAVWHNQFVHFTANYFAIPACNAVCLQLPPKAARDHEWAKISSSGQPARSRRARHGKNSNAARARSVLPSRARRSSSFAFIRCRWMTSDAAYSSCAGVNSSAAQSELCCCFDRSTPTRSRARSLSPCRSV